MSDKIYPAILKLDNGCIVLATKLRCGIALIEYKNEYEKIYKNSYYEDFHGFESATNITREYLEGKCVKVISPEHSEQIIMLCKNSGIGEDTHRNKSFAHIEDGELYFTDDVPEMDNGDNFEQITIPLPPKESNTSSGECYGRKTDDKWPRVGGKVTWGSCVANAEVIATHNKTAWVLNEHGSCDNVEIAKLKKPKTEAEILRDELTQDINEMINNDSSTNAFVDLIIDKYIAKNPQ